MRKRKTRFTLIIIISAVVIVPLISIYVSKQKVCEVRVSMFCRIDEVKGFYRMIINDVKIIDNISMYLKSNNTAEIVPRIAPLGRLYTRYNATDVVSYTWYVGNIFISDNGKKSQGIKSDELANYLLSLVKADGVSVKLLRISPIQ